MRRVFEAFVLCSSLVLGGCGGSGTSSTATAPAAQHGGNVVTLPGGKGFAELMIDKSTPTKVASKTRLLAYFYQPDGTSALTPPPSDVKVRLGSAETGTDVKLTAQTAPPGLFASEPGQFPDELRGQLELTLGGEPLQTAFMFR